LRKLSRSSPSKDARPPSFDGNHSLERGPSTMYSLLRKRGAVLDSVFHIDASNRMTTRALFPSPSAARPLGLAILFSVGVLFGLVGCDSNQAEDEVSGSGEAPVFALSPSAHDFGFTHVGTPQTQTFAIVNDGDAPPDSVERDGVLEGEIRLGGPNPERFSFESGDEGTYVLEPGDSLRVVIEFDPIEDQKRSAATLSITHNGDDQESPFTVPLEGDGVMFEGGSGTPSNPYQVIRPDQLQVINNGLREDHFIQVGDVNAESTAEWNEGDGFIPIGRRSEEERFTGTFDGNGHVISNLQISRSGTNGVGLFAAVGPTIVQDVTLRDADITGNTQVGGVVGQNDGGTIQQATVEGRIEGNVSVGGVVGLSFDEGTVENVRSEAAVSGEALVGGLVGRNITNSDLRRSTVQGSVTGTGDPGQVGGLVGRNVESTVSRSLVRGDVSSSGERGQVGGLVGRNVNGSIQNSEYVQGTVEGTVSAGGIVGANFDEGEVRRSRAGGTVISDDRAGGLVGRNALQSTILNSGSTADVEAPKNAGGVAGLNRDSVRGCWSRGPVQGDTNAGGIVGANLGTVEASYAQGAVNGSSRIGGLVGRGNEGSVHRSYAVGTVSGSSSAGGLVGRQAGGTVTAGYWNTDATRQSEAVGTEEKTSVEARGLTESEMTGTAARENMQGLDFERTWQVESGEYPHLRWEQ
jgi:hypothetical protein